MNINIIFGPPGTGKTTTLLNILEEELNNCGPEEIAYVSFSRKGAYEGRDRALIKFPQYNKRDFKYFRTLHSIAFTEVGASQGMMIEKKHYKQFGEKLGFKFSGFFSEDMQQTKDDQYLMFDILFRNNRKYAQKMLGQLEAQQLRYIRLNYKHFRESLGIFDFTDLIEMFVSRNKSLPVKVAIIDEAQDLTTLQWQMVLTAFKNCERVYIAGDDDQALYQWSGADVDFFLNIKGNQRVLDRSYRLPRSILNYSTQITDLITRRAPKTFSHKDGEDGTVQLIASLDEVDLTNGKWMIISRNIQYLMPVMQTLRDKTLMFSYKGKPSVLQGHIQAINHYENIRKTGKVEREYLLQDVLDLNVRQRYKDPWYDAFHIHPDIIMYYRDILREGVDTREINIEVNTIHGVKGGEADNVILLLDYSRNVRKSWDSNPDSELRCYYVGATRAKQNLYVMPTQSRYGYPLMNVI